MGGQPDGTAPGPFPADDVIAALAGHVSAHGHAAVARATGMSPARIDEAARGRGRRPSRSRTELVAQAAGYDLTACGVPPWTCWRSSAGGSWHAFVLVRDEPDPLERKAFRIAGGGLTSLPPGTEARRAAGGGSAALKARAGLWFREFTAAHGADTVSLLLAGAGQVPCAGAPGA